MNMKNNPLSIIYISAIIVSLFFTSCQHVIDGISYKITSDSTVSVEKLKDESLVNIIIPPKIVLNGHEYFVTSIGEGAFFSTQIESVKLPNTVKVVGQFAFYECSNLRNVQFS